MKFYGLFGYPLGHSISPAIHHKIYELAEIEGAYKKFEVAEEDLKLAIQGVKVLGIAGANVTIPYKEKVMPLLDEVSQRSQRLHSVNTIKNTAGILTGYNTDYDGIALTFKIRNWQVAGKDIYVLGSGGASNGVTYFLSDQGARSITVVSRSPEKYEGPWNCIDYQSLAQVKGDYLINCTPVGMYPKVDVSPVVKETLNHFKIAFDMIYNPAETLFLQYAREAGLDYANGLDMLVGQAIRSVEIWEDRKFEDSLVMEILDYFRKNWEVSV